MKRLPFVTILLLIAVVGGVMYTAVRWPHLFSKPTPILPAPSEFKIAFQNRSIAGFEGDFTETTLTINMSWPGTILFTNPPETKSKVIMSEQGRAHTIEVFYNGAAGFSSSRNLWNEHLKSRCPDCHELSAQPLPIKNASDFVAFANQKHEIIIFAHEPGFLILTLEKPSEDARIILSLLQIENRKVPNPEQPLPTSSPKPIPSGYSSSEINVKFREGVVMDKPELLLPPSLRSSLVNISLLFPNFPELHRWVRIVLRPGTDAAAFLDDLKHVDSVEIAEPAPLPAPPPK